MSCLEDVIVTLLLAGKGAWMSKHDLCEAFQTLPVQVRPDNTNDIYKTNIIAGGPVHQTSNPSIRLYLPSTEEHLR